jgi:uncharacterized RDD family membrane protein YckC
MAHHVKYAEFSVRLMASLIDTLILAVPLGIVVYFLSDGQWMNLDQWIHALQMAQQGNINALGQRPQPQLQWELLFQFLMAMVVLVFWKRWAGATPGKKMMGIEVVSIDGATALSNQQILTRYIGYIASTLPLLLGFVMIAFRSDKRALHDLLAGTAVIYSQKK